MTRKFAIAAALVVAVLTAVTGSIASSSHSSAIPAGDWLSFGRTPENNRLSPLDVSFLYLEERTTPMHVGSVMSFRPGEAGLDWSRLVRHVEARSAG